LSPEPAARPISRQPPDGGEVMVTEPPLARTERLSDHGPSRSKVTHTIVGAQISQAALAAMAAKSPDAPPGASAASWHEGPARRDDSITIPTSSAPAWMVGGVVLTALALALVAGYYLLR